MKISRKLIFVLSVLGFLVVFHQACSSGKKSSSSSALDDDEGSGNFSDGESLNVSSNYTTHTMSASNRTSSGKTVNRKKALNAVKQITKSITKNDKRAIQKLSGLIAAQRLANISFGGIEKTAKALMGQVLAKSLKNKIPEAVALNLALVAFSQGKYHQCNYYLLPLLGSKKKKIKAGALTIRGMMFSRVNRTMEAAEAYRLALKADSGYTAAKLNLGFISVRNGAFREGARYLSGTQQTWQTLMGRSIAARMLGKPSEAEDYCKAAIKKSPKNKQLMYNCAVGEFQSAGNYKTTKAKLETALKVSDRSNTGRLLDERISRYITKVNIAAQKQKEFARVRELERKRKEAASRAKESASRKAQQKKQNIEKVKDAIGTEDADFAE